MEAVIPVPASKVEITRIISRIGQTEADVTQAEAKNGRLKLRLSEHPVFIEPAEVNR